DLPTLVDGQINVSEDVELAVPLVDADHLNGGQIALHLGSRGDGRLSHAASQAETRPSRPRPTLLTDGREYAGGPWLRQRTALDRLPKELAAQGQLGFRACSMVWRARG